ncbi:MAG: FtsW/RodA/SpoVE family cell cycle protein [Bacteroidota bacterium]
MSEAIENKAPSFFRGIKGDKVIWAVVILLSIMSILAVYSSTGTLAYKQRDGNTEYFLIKHGGILLFGLFLMYVAHLIKYTYYSRIAQILLLITYPLLILTLFMGTNLNEASRWLTLPGTSMTFQTSDLAKLALIMYIARLLAKKQDEIKDFKSAFLPIMLPVLIICALILPGNLSTCMMVMATALILMFIGRMNMKYLLGFVGAGLAMVTIFIMIALNSPNKGRAGTWMNRIDNFFKPNSKDNYQVEQAKIAIATGGIIGKLPGNSTQRNFLPHPYSDFIFAIILEEYGLLGGFVILMLYLILLYRAAHIATKCDRIFPALLVTGCALMLVFQALVNMAVAVNLMPVTGQPLPLISMGGTSLWFTSISIGIILSVSRSTEDEESEEKTQEIKNEPEHGIA